MSEGGAGVCERGRKSREFVLQDPELGRAQEREREKAQPGEAEVKRKISRGEAYVRKTALQRGTLSHPLPRESLRRGIMASLVLRTVCIFCILPAVLHVAFSQQLNTVYRVSPLFI